LLDFNNTLAGLTGRTRAELLDLTFPSLLSPAGQIFYETNLRPMLRVGEEVREIALEIRQPDHSRVPVLLSADRFEGDGFVRLAVFGATHRHAYEQDLREAKRRAEAAERRARELARTVQQVLIPPRPPSIPGIDLAASYRPAGNGEEVGGDFYDVFQVGSAWFAIIGDVRGKGAEAAVVTALLRHAVREAAAWDPRPDSILRTVNRVLLDDQYTDRFCTALLAKLTPVTDEWSVEVAVAGHPLPVLVAVDGQIETVGRPGSLLGVIPDIDVVAAPVSLDRGQTLLMYTDGVTEARRDGEFFSDTGLHAAASRHADGPEALVAGVLAEVLDFQGGTAYDDIALVAIRLG
jgi:sigma-B regulation protein RsbU (phosphoserine phosphatase)